MEDRVIVAVQLLKVQADSLKKLISNGDLHSHGIIDVDLVKIFEGEGFGHFQRLLQPQEILDLSNELDQKKKSFVLDLKLKLAKDLETAIEALGAKLDPESKIFNDYVLLSEKFYRIHNGLTKDLVSFENANRELSRISNSIILLVDNLAVEDVRL